MALNRTEIAGAVVENRADSEDGHWGKATQVWTYVR